MNKQKKATLYEPTEGERVGKRLGGIVNTSVFVYVYTRCIYFVLVIPSRTYTKKKKKKGKKKFYFFAIIFFVQSSYWQT